MLQVSGVCESGIIYCVLNNNILCSQMYCFLGTVKKCQKKEREVIMGRLHLMRICCLMKDSSYGCKSQKLNIKLYANFAVMQ